MKSLMSGLCMMVLAVGCASPGPDPEPRGHAGDGGASMEVSQQAASTQTEGVSPWGEQVRGLQLQANAPSEIEQGMYLTITGELRCERDKLDAGVSVLDTFLWERQFILDLTNFETRKPFEVHQEDPARGMPAMRIRDHTIALDGTPIRPQKLEFLLARFYEELSPGRYDCRVKFATPDVQVAARHWHGTVVSGPFTVEILPETPKTQTFLLPERLQLVRGPELYGGHLLVNYAEEDAEEVAVPVRNGHFIGTRCRRGSGEGLRGGAPTPNDVNGFDQLHQYDGGDLDRSYRITVFETCESTGHFWSPHGCGYKVLWEKTLELHMIEAEIAAIKAD